MNILLAGMASDTAALLEKLLAVKGHDLAMTSGVGAIDAVRAGSRFVVVEEPPDMTAPELCRRIRDVQGGDDTVILVVSPREEEVAAAVAAGASDFFLTSLGPAAFAARLLVAERRVEKHADLRRQLDRVRELTAAQEVDARFRALLEGAPDAMIIAGPDGRITLVNRQAETLFGYARDELVGQTIEVLLPPRFRDGHAAQRGKFFSNPTRREMAVRPGLVARRKDGTEFPVEISLSPLHTEHGVIVSSVIRDISERMRVEALLRAAQEDLEARVEARTAELSRANEALLKSEQQLRQSQKMEAIGVLAGGVAHDFNNLLTVILSNAQLLQGDLDPNDARRADVAEIEHAAARAADLTRQLLAFSRRQVLKPRVVDVNEIVHGIEKMLRRLIGEDIELALRSAATSGQINVDVAQIENVVVNLVVNARDAMPRGGKLSIETADVEPLEAETPFHPSAKVGPHVMLAVRDTGTGMDEATRTRIFEPFFTTKGTGKGTGLGLSTVLGIVEQSDGFVVVRSEPGQGTSIEAYFPRGGRSTGTVSDVPAPATLRGSETILLVEDDASVRAVIRNILSRYGYEVLEAQGGEEALRRSHERQGKIDLLLTDVVMPRMSGPQVVQMLRPLRPDMKALFMSGYTDSSIARHAIAESGVDLIQKPLTPEVLARKIREVLDAAEIKAPK